MGAGTKGLSEKIVDKCIENPKFALLLVPLGIALVLWGVSDARYYRSLSGRPTLTVQNAEIVSMPNEKGFTIPHVVGKAGDKDVVIPISSKAARRLEGETVIECLETGDQSSPYLLRSTVDGQLSSILFTAAGIPFNHIAILGLAIGIGACAWSAFAKPPRVDAVK